MNGIVFITRLEVILVLIVNAIGFPYVNASVYLIYI